MGLGVRFKRPETPLDAAPLSPMPRFLPRPQTMMTAERFDKAASPPPQLLELYSYENNQFCRCVMVPFFFQAQALNLQVMAALCPRHLEVERLSPCRL